MEPKGEPEWSPNRSRNDAGTVKLNSVHAINVLRSGKQLKSAKARNGQNSLWGVQHESVERLLAGTEVVEKMTFVESGVNRDLRASLASEASQALQRHRYFWVYSRLRKSWSEFWQRTLFSQDSKRRRF